ncbi:MAG: hypothetical protein U9Q06_01795 [Nanoarchaeota archaeon]|nr:hypothetical protein [Nanoarchaeota archaeon]
MKIKKSLLVGAILLVSVFAFSFISAGNDCIVRSGDIISIKYKHNGNFLSINGGVDGVKGSMDMGLNANKEEVGEEGWEQFEITELRNYQRVGLIEHNDLISLKSEREGLTKKLVQALKASVWRKRWLHANDNDKGNTFKPFIKKYVGNGNLKIGESVYFVYNNQYLDIHNGKDYAPAHLSKKDINSEGEGKNEFVICDENGNCDCTSESIEVEIGVDFHDADEVKIEIEGKDYDLQSYVDGKLKLWDGSKKSYQDGEEIKLEAEGEEVNLQSWVDGETEEWTTQSVWHDAKVINVLFDGAETTLQNWVDNGGSFEQTTYYSCPVKERVGSCDNNCNGQLYTNPDKTCIQESGAFCKQENVLDCDTEYNGIVYLCPKITGRGYTTCNGKYSSLASCELGKEKINCVRSGWYPTKFEFEIPRAMEGGEIDYDKIAWEEVDDLLYSGGIERQESGEDNLEQCSQQHTDLKGEIKLGEGEWFNEGSRYFLECYKNERDIHQVSAFEIGSDYTTVYTDVGTEKRVKRIGLFGGLNYYAKRNKADKFEYQIAVIDGKLKSRIKDVGEHCHITDEALETLNDLVMDAVLDSFESALDDVADDLINNLVDNTQDAVDDTSEDLEIDAELWDGFEGRVTPSGNHDGLTSLGPKSGGNYGYLCTKTTSAVPTGTRNLYWNSNMIMYNIIEKFYSVQEDCGKESDEVFESSNYPTRIGELSGVNWFDIVAFGIPQEFYSLDYPSEFHSSSPVRSPIYVSTPITDDNYDEVLDWFNDEGQSEDANDLISEYGSGREGETNSEEGKEYYCGIITNKLKSEEVNKYIYHYKSSDENCRAGHASYVTKLGPYRSSIVPGEDWTSVPSGILNSRVLSSAVGNKGISYLSIEIADYNKDRIERILAKTSKAYRCTPIELDVAPTPASDELNVAGDFYYNPNRDCGMPSVGYTFTPPRSKKCPNPGDSIDLDDYDNPTVRSLNSMIYCVEEIEVPEERAVRPNVEIDPEVIDAMADAMLTRECEKTLCPINVYNKRVSKEKFIQAQWDDITCEVILV